jgi:hypothetical protein
MGDSDDYTDNTSEREHHRFDVYDNHEEEYYMYSQDALRILVVWVAYKKELEGIPGRLWVMEVVDKLNKVGVVYLKDLIKHSVNLNKMLIAARHPRFHAGTLTIMMVKLSEMVLVSDE